MWHHSALKYRTTLHFSERVLYCTIQLSVVMHENDKRSSFSWIKIGGIIQITGLIYSELPVYSGHLSNLIIYNNAKINSL